MAAVQDRVLSRCSDPVANDPVPKNRYGLKLHDMLAFISLVTAFRLFSKFIFIPRWQKASRRSALSGESNLSNFSRRELLGSALGGVTAASIPHSVSVAAAAQTTTPQPAQTKAPFASMRDYVSALEARNLLVRIPRVDQDTFEGTALMYRARDLYGMRGAPAFLFEEIRINGRWVKGPLLINESGHGWGESIVYGLDPVDDGPVIINPFNSYRQARAHVEQMLDENDGEYATIDPVAIDAAQAPCKEIVLTGDDIDLTKFAFIQGNPVDAGRYINTGCVFTSHPKYGVNFRHLSLPSAWSKGDRFINFGGSDGVSTLDGRAQPRRKDWPGVDCLDAGPLCLVDQRQQDVLWPRWCRRRIIDRGRARRTSH